MSGKNTLLFADSAINLVLGLLLLFFPERVVRMLGVPPSDLAFYPSLLGAVLFGIGLALYIEAVSSSGKGLGLWGAIAINLSAGLVLGAWLLFGGLSLPARGFIFLWLLVLVLAGISLLEGWAQLRARF